MLHVGVATTGKRLVEDFEIGRMPQDDPAPRGQLAGTALAAHLVNENLGSSVADSVVVRFDDTSESVQRESHKALVGDGKTNALVVVARKSAIAVRRSWGRVRNGSDFPLHGGIPVRGTIARCAPASA